MSDSDSDSDYVVVCEDNPNTGTNDANTDRASRVNDAGAKVRGKDVDWMQVEMFTNTEEFKTSKKKTMLDEHFTRRKNRSFAYGDVENFVCKFARKVGYVSCPLKYKVTFMSSSSEVSVECNIEDETHDHQRDDDVRIDGKLFRWTDEQEKEITKSIKNHVKAAQIERRLNEKNLFQAQKPTKQQLYNKIANTKKKIFKHQSIVNTHDLRQRVSEHLKVPEDDVQGFVVHSSIEDENEEEEPRFTVIFSTTKNLGKLKSERLLQTDATYRLNWLGFPVFVIGNIMFFVLHLCLCVCV
jgi:hypothetical protein